MRQIDIMINHQRREWETEIQTMGCRLKTTEEELLTSKSLIERRELEVKDKAFIKYCFMMLLSLNQASFPSKMCFYIDAITKLNNQMLIV